MSKKITIAVLHWAVIFSVLSQVQEQDINKAITRALMFASWSLVFIVMFLRRKRNFRFSRFTQEFIFVFMSWYTICAIYSAIGSEHTSGFFVHCLLVALFACIVADAYRGYITVQELRNVIQTFVISSFIYAIYVHVVYFPSISSWLSDFGYSFRTKNSAAAMWFSAVVFGFKLLPCYQSDKNARFTRFLYDFMLLYIFFMILIVHCRAVIFAIVGASFFYIILYAKNRKFLLFMLAIIIITCLSVAPLREFIEHVIYLEKIADAKINMASLDTFSSGRMSLYTRALDIFYENFMLGRGKYFVESTYIAILAEGGIIGFTLIIYIWLRRIITISHKRNLHASSKNMLIIMAIFYSIEALFEGGPPFGPGGFSFMFWIVSEILDDEKSS